MPNVRYTELFNVDSATMTIVRKGDGWSAKLTTNRRVPSFVGTGASVVEAIESALQTVKTEKRGASKGRKDPAGRKGKFTLPF